MVNNIQECIQLFYEALDQNDFDLARRYLKKLDSIGQPEELKQVLTNTENRLINKKSNNNMKKDQEKNKDFNARDFIKQKLEQLYERGMVLLNPMDNDKLTEIKQVVDYIPDVVSFSIQVGDTKQIVLRYKPYPSNTLNRKELFTIGNNAFNNKDYDTCINAYRQLLEVGNPKSFIYAKLGFTYLKKHDKRAAIDFLTVANELVKNEDASNDYTEVINSLKGLIPREDRKRYVRMTTTDFENDLDNHYGIEQLEQIAELISTGMSPDEACINIDLTEEQKNIVLLIYTRECYAKENYKEGDKYFKKVERTKKKSKQLKALIEEIRRNKRFYKNRLEEGQKHLVLTSK